MLCTVAVNLSSSAEDIEETIVYKLAIIHEHGVDPETIFLGDELDPKRAVVTEFQWILDSMEHRCTNSRKEIATIIIDAWKLVKIRKYDMTLLETARALSAHARNRVLFGHGEIDFRASSGLWTKTHKPFKSDEE